MSILTVALDAMGGDRGPSETVPAAAQALSCLDQLEIILVGDQVQLAPYLEQYSLTQHPRIQIQHASQQVSMNDRPVIALRAKTDSSMRVALELVKSGRADACVSAGNTGALMVMSMRVLTMLPYLKRPALCSSLPHLQQGATVMLDLGSNIHCTPDMLWQFACMGDLLAKCLHDLKRPRIALLNVGEEMIKGSKLVQEAATLISQSKNLNFTGFIEGDQLFTGAADVVVCDGFTGNIALKTAEGIARIFYNHLVLNKKEHNSNLNYPDSMQSSLALLHPDQYNGASLLGLNGIVIKSHGRADRRALSNAILHAVAEIQQQMPKRISECFVAEHTYER